MKKIPQLKETLEKKTLKKLISFKTNCSFEGHFRKEDKSISEKKNCKTNCCLTHKATKKFPPPHPRHVSCLVKRRGDLKCQSVTVSSKKSETFLAPQKNGKLPPHLDNYNGNYHYVYDYNECAYAWTFVCI